MAHGAREVVAFQVAFRIRRRADAKARLDERRDDVLRIAEIGAARAGRGSFGDIPAQREHVFHTRRAHLVDLRGEVRALERDAGEVGDRGDSEFRIDHLGDLRGGGVVARSSSRIGDADEVGPQGREGGGDFSSSLERELAFGRKHLERDGEPAESLRRFEDIGYIHGEPSPCNGSDSL